MIALVCVCGSQDLVPNGDYFEAECKSCGRHLHLWEMRPILIPAASSEDETTKVSEPIPALLA